jgi:hypothetical protein
LEKEIASLWRYRATPRNDGNSKTAHAGCVGCFL